MDDLIELVKVQTLEILDLSSNKIETPEIVPAVLMKLPSLAILNMTGNDINKKITNYRKTMIHLLKSLKLIDEFPIEKVDRSMISFHLLLRGLADAFVQGGIDKERDEQSRWIQE